MKYAPIVPKPLLPMLKSFDYHMILAQMCRDPEYGSFYNHLRGYRILDNGSAEGELMNQNELLKWAYVMNADEVIAPDIMYDMEKSADMLIEFCRMVMPMGIKVMAVLQATNWSEFDTILDVALTMNVASLALPKLLAKHMGTSARLAATNIIRERTDKPIHCLGCTTYLREVKDLARQGIVRGIDSAAPVVLGLQGRLVSFARYDWETSHKAIPDFWNCTGTEEVIDNVTVFRRWCETETSPIEM